MPAPKSNDVTFTVKAEITRDYGVIKATFGYAETFHSEDGHTQLTGYRKCLDQIGNMFDDYEANDLPNVKQAEYQRQIEQPTQQQGVWLDAVEFVHEQKQGKDYYNVRAGRYQKFGIACWPECENRADAIKELGTRWSMPVDWKVLVDETGKYPKVLRIELAPF